MWGRRARRASVADLRDTAAQLMALEMAAADRCAVVARLLAGIDGGNPDLDRLADITAAAQAATGAAYAEVALLTAEGNVFLAGDSIAPVAGPRPDSYCRLTLTGRPVVVRDSLATLLLADNPYRGRVRSYLGVPLCVDGEVVGALCAYGPRPVEWTPAQELALIDLAGQASRHLAGP